MQIDHLLKHMMKFLELQGMTECLAVVNAASVCIGMRLPIRPVLPRSASPNDDSGIDEECGSGSSRDCADCADSLSVDGCPSASSSSTSPPISPFHCHSTTATRLTLPTICSSSVAKRRHSAAIAAEPCLRDQKVRLYTNQPNQQSAIIASTRQIERVTYPLVVTALCPLQLWPFPSILGSAISGCICLCLFHSSFSSSSSSVFLKSFLDYCLLCPVHFSFISNFQFSCPSSRPSLSLFLISFFVCVCVCIVLLFGRISYHCDMAKSQNCRQTFSRQSSCMQPFILPSPSSIRLISLIVAILSELSRLRSFPTSSTDFTTLHRSANFVSLPELPCRPLCAL